MLVRGKPTLLFSSTLATSQKAQSLGEKLFEITNNSDDQIGGSVLAPGYSCNAEAIHIDALLDIFAVFRKISRDDAKTSCR